MKCEFQKQNDKHIDYKIESSMYKLETIVSSIFGETKNINITKIKTKKSI